MRRNILLASAFALTLAGAAAAQQPPPVDSPSTDRSAGASSSPDATASDRSARDAATKGRSGADSANSKASDAAACVTGERNANAKDCKPSKSSRGDDARSPRDPATDTAPRTSNPSPPM